MIDNNRVAFPLIIKNFLLTLSILTAAWLLCVVLRMFSSGTSYASMIFILAVFIVSRVTYSLVYGILASVAGVLAVNYYFTYPYFNFNFTLAGYPLTIACMLFVSLSTCTMTARLRASEKIKHETEMEKMRSNLLRAISHDLRTPLTSIIGAADAIAVNISLLSKDELLSLLNAIHDDAQWLSRMVENLLTVTRLGADGENTIKLIKKPEVAEEIVSEAVSVFKKRFPNESVRVSIPPEPLFVPMDALLIEQVIINILENAALHSKSSVPVELNVSCSEQEAVFSVSDKGKGLQSTVISKLSGSYLPKNADSDKNKGLGIGLSICETIISAHGGKLSAENRTTGGACFKFTLPLE